MDANDSVRISTKLTIDAGKDGIHCENTDDASLGFICISGGTNITLKDKSGKTIITYAPELSFAVKFILYVYNRTYVC